MQWVLFNHDPLRMQEINTNVELIKLLINLINWSHQLLHITDVRQVSPWCSSYFCWWQRPWWPPGRAAAPARWCLGRTTLRAPTPSTRVRQTFLTSASEYSHSLLPHYLLYISKSLINLKLKRIFTNMIYIRDQCAYKKVGGNPEDTFCFKTEGATHTTQCLQTGQGDTLPSILNNWI